MGRSWGGLGRSWGDLGAISRAIQFSIDFLSDFGRPRGAKREAFGEPKWPKIGPKTHPKLRRILISKKWPSKIVLEPSWVDFKRFWLPSWGPKRRFRIGKTNTGAKLVFLQKIRCQEAAWTELGRTWVPKGRHLGSPNGSKSDSKFIQN